MNCELINFLCSRELALAPSRLALLLYAKRRLIRANLIDINVEGQVSLDVYM